MMGKSGVFGMRTAVEIHAHNLYISPWQSRNVNLRSPNIDKSLLSHRDAKTHIDSRSGHPTALQVARNEIQHNGNNGLPVDSAGHKHQNQYVQGTD